MVHEFLRNPSADVKQHILEQKSIMQAQCDQLEQQRVAIEHHLSHSDAPTSPNANMKRKWLPGGAFAKSLVENVAKVREQVQTKTTPATVLSLAATDDEQLLYQLEWEYHELILQNETTLS